ncbi:macrophage mannose receptor 1-like, partial [Clarias magur]
HSNITTFHVIPVLMTQSEAREACRGKYTDLVTVYSDEDNTELYHMTMKAGAGWLGLYRGQFSEKWSNGDPVTFSNLAGDCGTSSCCAVMKPDGSWESLQCTETRYFMCYEQATGDNKAKPNYHLILENKTWYEAQHYCRGNYTDLVSIRDQHQNEEVKIKGLNSSTSFWIGRLCDDWQWTDGYRNWGGFQPQPSPNDCVYLIGGTWISVPCDNMQYTLCYTNSSIHVSAKALSWQEALDYCNEENRAGILNIDSEAEQEEVEFELRRRRVPRGSLWVGLGPNHLSERQTGPGPSHCPADTHTAEAAPDYVMDSDKLRAVTMVTVSVLLLLLSVFSPPVHSNITTFHVIPVLMTQSEAREACRGKYTDLVTVYSDEDNTELYHMTMKAGAGWIGLYRGQFSEKWSNGDPVTFSNLAGDCGTSSCCAVMKPDGSWESLQCTETKYFMCYGQGDNKDYSNYRLILENKTWYDAEHYCRGHYTDLVSIRDQHQNEEVKIKGLNSSTSFWIGLLRDDWQWTDGGNSAYRNWDWWSGQPRASTYDCVYLIGGKWISVPCNNREYTLCYN